MYNTLDDESVLLLESNITMPISTHTGAVPHTISVVLSSTDTQNALEFEDNLSTEALQAELLDDAEKDMDILVQKSFDDWDE